MSKNTTVRHILIGEYNGKSMVVFTDGPTDRYTFTFGPVKAGLFVAALESAGVDTVVTAVRALAEGKPVQAKGPNMLVSEYLGKPTLAFVAGKGETFGLTFGAGKARKVVQAIDVNGLDTVLKTLYNVAGKDAPKPVKAPKVDHQNGKVKAGKKTAPRKTTAAAK